MHALEVLTHRSGTPDIHVEDHGTLVLLRPATNAGETWLDEHVSDETNLAAAKSSATAQDAAQVLAQVEPYEALLAATGDHLPAVRRALRLLGVLVRVHPVDGPVGHRSVTVEVAGSFRSLLPDDVLAAYFSAAEEPAGVETWAVQELRPITGGSDAPLAGCTVGGCSHGQGPPTLLLGCGSRVPAPEARRASARVAARSGTRYPLPRCFTRRPIGPN